MSASLTTTCHIPNRSHYYMVLLIAQEISYVSQTNSELVINISLCSIILVSLTCVLFLLVCTQNIIF